MLLERLVALAQLWENRGVGRWRGGLRERELGDGRTAEDLRARGV